MKIGELFVALGFDVDDKKLKDFGAGIKSVRNDLFKMSAGAVASVYAVNKFVEGSVRSATALRNFTNETGSSSLALQKWQAVTVLTNASASADQVTSSLKAMSGAIADVTMGRGGGEFAMLGIPDVRGMDADNVLNGLRENFNRNIEKWGYKQTIDLMKAVGFDESMLPALKLSIKEFENISKDIVSQEALDKAVVLGEHLAKMKWELKLFKDQATAEIAPKLMKFMEKSLPMVQDFSMGVSDLSGNVKDMWDSFNSTGQSVAIASMVGLLAVLNPVSASLALIMLILTDIGRMKNGKGSMLQPWMEDMGIYEMVDKFKAKNNYSTHKMKSIGSGGIPSGASTDFSKYNSNAKTYNFTINSSADPVTLSDMVYQRLNQGGYNLNTTSASLNNGVAG